MSSFCVCDSFFSHRRKRDTLFFVSLICVKELKKKAYFINDGHGYILKLAGYCLGLEEGDELRRLGDCLGPPSAL